MLERRTKLTRELAVIEEQYTRSVQEHESIMKNDVREFRNTEETRTLGAHGGRQQERTKDLEALQRRPQ